jgi:hypothetical protein
MTTLYPANIDTFVNPSPTDSVQTLSHSGQHTKANNAIYALQIKLGADNSYDQNSIDYKLRTLKSFVDNITTAEVVEATGYQYFTKERAQDAVAEAFAAGTHSHILVTYDDVNNKFSLSTAPEVVLSSALDDTLGEYLTLSVYEDEKASAGGIATLGLDGKLEASQIPPSIATDAQSRADQALSAAGTYTDEKIADLVDSAPAVLNTLNELAQALGDDANFASTMATSLSGKSPVGHTHTSTNITDFLEAAQDASALLFNHANHNNVTATYDDDNNKIILTVNPQLTQEQVQDYIVPLFQSANNKNMNIMYDDDNNRLILEAITEPSKAVMADVAPSDPAHGAFWLDTDEFRSGVRALKIYNKYPAAYRGDYNNGAYYAINDVVSIPVGSPYGIVGSYFIRSGNPGNPGYPPEPGGATNGSWTMYSFAGSWEYASTSLGLATENVWTAKNTFNQGVIIGMDIAPSNPVEGQIYYNLAAEKLRVFDGLVWKDVSGGAGGGGGLPSISTDGTATPATLFFGMIAPPNAAALEGDIWFDVDDLGEPYGQFFTGLTAPDPDQYEFWIDPSLSPGELIYSADEPTTPQYQGELWIDTDDLDGQLLEVGSSTPNPENVQLWVDINDLDTPSYYTNLVFTTYANYAAFPVAGSKPGMLAVDATTGLVYISINGLWVMQPRETEHAKTRIQSQSSQALVWMGFL